VQARAAPRQAEVERIPLRVREIAHSGLTLSKLSVAAGLLGDLLRD
jgi:glutamate dehydrogenase